MIDEEHLDNEAWKYADSVFDKRQKNMSNISDIVNAFKAGYRLINKELNNK